MRQLTKIRNIINQSGGKFLGVNKSHGRVTVEPTWKLTMTDQVYGNLDTGPYRWWNRLDQSQVEVEVPNIQTISIDRSLDQDAATCTIVMSNQSHDDNTEIPDSPDQLGNPGFYGFGFGGAPDFARQWGHTENTWKDVLIPNALLRTYQGYGGYTEVDGELVPDAISTAVSSGNLALSGVWLIDTVSLGTSGMIRLQCRDMGKLLIDQMIYTPLVPERYYPPKWCRFDSIEVPSTPSSDGVPPPEPLRLGPAQLRYEDSSVARWLGANTLIGGLAPNAFSANETETTIGHGWRFWNNDYAKDWWQATCNTEINEIYISAVGDPPGGAYFGYISIMENGVWQGPVNIPYDDTGNIATFHPDKPDLETGIRFVKAFGISPSASINTDTHDGVWVLLDRVYDAQRIRITMGSTWEFPFYPVNGNRFVSGLGNVSAKLTNIDTMTETPTVAATTEEIQVDGNIKDWLDPVKELLMWAGFLLYEGVILAGEGTRRDLGPFGTFENAGTWPLECLHEDLFDKKSVMDAITSIKEVLGYVFFIDEDGGAHFHSPNWWSSGNTDNQGVRHRFIHEITDQLTLTDYTATYTDSSVRSEVVIGSTLTDEQGGNAQFVSIDPSVVLADGTPDLLRGMVRPAIWENDVWTDLNEQRLMAALISLHIMFNSRQGSVTIVANPEIQINDQVRITERISSESFIHYVRSISSEMNLETGQWTMTLGTNWLGEQDIWVIDRDRLLDFYNQ